MAHYLLLLHEKPGESPKLDSTEIQGIVARYSAWAEALRRGGRLLASEKLREDGGKILRREGSEVVVTDGPEEATEEIASGYFVIQAADYADAVTIVRGCPHTEFGSIEIREIEPIH